MKNLDRKILQRLLKLAGDRLSGDWVLIGGTVLMALEPEYRATTDVDLIGLGKRDQGDTLKLMELAEELGLPVETINQAGAFFLTKIPGFREHLVPLYEGKKARILRPDAILFVQLKIPRLSESDLADCVAFLKFANEGDRKALRKLVEKAQTDTTAGEARRARLESLAEHIGRG